MSQEAWKTSGEPTQEVSMELKNRVIVVTGAARGIGRALATRFASAEPLAVFIADIDGLRLADVAREIGATAIQCDVSRESDIHHLITHVESTHGRIDVFCSNAGIAVGGGPETPNDQWQRIWDVNVMSHVLVARHLLPGMLAGNEGYIVGTVSAAGTLITFFLARHCCTKAAALSFFEWLAILHGDAGVPASRLCPHGAKTGTLAAEHPPPRGTFLTP